MADSHAPNILRRLGRWVVRHGSRVATVAMSLLLAGVGSFALHWREALWPRMGWETVDWQEMGMDPIQSFSFDVPFLMREALPGWVRPVAGPPRSVDGVVILYMDDESAGRLGQPLGGAWSRAVHAQMVDWLAEQGAREVMFDVVFDTESPDDAKFAAALAKQGHVFLGAAIEASAEKPITLDEAERYEQVGIDTKQLKKPTPVLRKAARGWGLLTFRPQDPDGGVRRLFTGKPREGLEPWPSATWQLAQATGANLSQDEAIRFQRRWVNYYGNTGRIESMSYYRPLVADGGVPPGYFKDKVVFIGARSELGVGLASQRDRFTTPWSRFQRRSQAPGVEIHATAYLNLMQHDWLERVPLAVQRWSVIFIGLALGLLRLLRPWRAVIISLLAALALFAGACLLQWRGRMWCNWAVPVLLQIPLAAVLAVGSRYYLEERRKRKLRAAFGFYLSPQLAEEIADRNFDLSPGGKKVVATLLFTDLAGYTSLAEELGDSKRLGDELVRYFSRTTHEILQENGTVIKFIGDSVYAAWGAPLPQADHAERAVRAAWRVAQVCDMDIAVPQPDGTTAMIPIHTRIGIHTGEALAGNLGSTKRFDYTLIGDSVNFAQRLEGANKFFGTTVLISDVTAQAVSGKFLLRRMGTFVLMGKKKPVVIHELLGPESAVRPAWLETFDGALAAWEAGDFPAARAAFEAVIAARPAGDGPAKFYLKRLEQAVQSAAWTGVVTLEGK